MGLSSKVVSNNEGFVAFESNWKTLLGDAPATTMPPQQTSLKQPPPKPSPARRRHPCSQNESEPPLKCPRCESTNTKFCYYNNYNKSQPRHFCKSCKRHWTKGGTLRNVPVGGGRKNKRQKTTPPPDTATAAAAASSDDRIFLGSWATAADLPPSANNPFHHSLNRMHLPPPPPSVYGWGGGDGAEDSVVTTSSGGGFAGELAAPAAALWSWDDIETLISSNGSSGL